MSSNPYQPPVSSGSSRGRPVRNLGGLTLGVNVVFSVMALALVTTAVASSLLVRRYGTDTLALEDPPADPLLFALGLSALGYALCLLVGIVIFCVWVYRANVNADALVSGATEFTPGWAVGWFFIPLANLFKPYQAVSEIYRASDPDADPDFWSVTPVPFYLPLWWGSWVAFNLIAGFNRPLFGQLSTTGPGSTAVLVEGAVGALAAVLLVVVTRRIHRLQVEKARRVPVGAGAPVVLKTNPYL